MTSPLIIQFFDELELTMIILFLIDDIGRSVNGTMQIILINNGNDNHKFDAIDNDFNYMDFGNFGAMINQMNSCFGHGLGTPLLQQQKQEQKHHGSGQQKVNTNTNKKNNTDDNKNMNKNTRKKGTTKTKAVTISSQTSVWF